MLTKKEMIQDIIYRAGIVKGIGYIDISSEEYITELYLLKHAINIAIEHYPDISLWTNMYDEYIKPLDIKKY